MVSDDTKSLICIFTQREWFRAWMGTSLAGGIYGVGLGCMGIRIGKSAIGGIEAVLAGGVVGLVLAGVVGAVVIPTVATLLWTLLLLDRNAYIEKALAGGLTGFICTPVSPHCFITGVLGAIGACLPVLVQHRFAHALSVKRPSRTRFRFSINGVLLRTFVVAVHLVIWKFLWYVINNPQDW